MGVRLRRPGTETMAREPLRGQRKEGEPAPPNARRSPAFSRANATRRARSTARPAVRRAPATSRGWRSTRWHGPVGTTGRRRL